jgi:hypothetical protein
VLGAAIEVAKLAPSRALSGVRLVSHPVIAPTAITIAAAPAAGFPAFLIMIISPAIIICSSDNFSLA